MPITVAQVLDVAKRRCHHLSSIASGKLRTNGANEVEVAKFRQFLDDIISELFTNGQVLDGYEYAGKADVELPLPRGGQFMLSPCDDSGRNEQVAGCTGYLIISVLGTYNIQVRRPA